MGGGWQETVQGGREGKGQAGTKRHLKRSSIQRGRRESLNGWTRGSGEREHACAWHGRMHTGGKLKMDSEVIVSTKDLSRALGCQGEGIEDWVQACHAQ